MSTQGADGFSLPEVGDDTLGLERYLTEQGLGPVAGLDEAGRGPLAGPVVAACVILPPKCPYHLLDDSKKLTAGQRQDLYQQLIGWQAAIGVATVSARTIDEINILQASLLAMKLAVEDCPGQPRFLLIDGTCRVPMELPQQTLVRGESKSASIAAASIVAKVTRDRLMAEYHRQFPEYDFQRNKGYPTRGHRQALAKYGPCALHRKSFKGVREFFSHQEGVRQRSLF